MVKTQVQEEIQNRYLDIINKNGGQLPAPLTNEEVEKQLEASLDGLAISYHDENTNDSIKEVLETGFLEAFTALKNLRESY